MAEKKYLDLAQELKLLISAILKQARRDLEKRLTEQGLSLSFLGFGVLSHLISNEQTIKELSDKMMLAPATLVPVIDQLEDKGLIKRQVDKVDRRRTPLMITPLGKKIITSCGHDDKIDVMANRLQAMGAEKSQELIDNLYQLGAAVIGLDTLDNILQRAKTQK